MASRRDIISSMEEETHNHPPHYGATPVADPVPTETPTNHHAVAPTEVPTVAEAERDPSESVVTPVVASVAKTDVGTVDDGRHTLTVGDAVRMGRERGYERAGRRWQDDCKHGIVDAVKRRVGTMDAWFMTEASVRDRLATLADRAATQRPDTPSASARPEATTEPDPTPRPTPTVEPTPGTTGGDRRMSDTALDDTDPFDMPDEPMLLKRYIYKQRNRLELARMKEEQLDKALVDQREETRSLREFLGGEGGIVRALTNAMTHLGLGAGKPDARDRQ